MHMIVILVAKYLIVVPVLAALWLLYACKTRDERLKLLVVAAAGGILALALAKIAGHFVASPRPFAADHVTPFFGHSTDNGFPSDHTLLSSFLAFVVLGYRRVYGVLLLVVALLIGGARVLANVHHGIDIAGAFIIAGVAAAAGFAGVRYIWGNRNMSKVSSNVSHHEQGH